jgi:Ca2+-transporting ATPase
LYDNLKKYVRFQVGNLIGFIVTFLGASIVNLLGGVPFIPLQTLYVNFTTLVFQSVGLGFGKPSGDLMQRKPRKSDEPILDRSTLVWLTIVGLVMGITTLGVIAWAKDNHGAEIAHTMGLTVFAIANIYYALTVKNEVRSVFSLDTFDDRRFVYTTLASAIAVLFGTQLNVFQRILKTTSLNLHEWLICIVAALSIVIASEIQKFIVRRRAQQTEPPTIAAAKAGT